MEYPSQLSVATLGGFSGFDAFDDLFFVVFADGVVVLY